MILSIGASEIEFDALEAEREFSKMENEVRMRSASPTIPLLHKVKQWLEHRGVKDCTLTSAWCVWWSVFEHVAKIGNREKINAELAFWFNVNPFELTEAERIGLIANLETVKAQKALQEGTFDGGDPEGVHALVMLATGDKELALRARGTALEVLANRQKD